MYNDAAQFSMFGMAVIPVPIVNGSLLQLIIGTGCLDLMAKSQSCWSFEWLGTSIDNSHADDNNDWHIWQVTTDNQDRANAWFDATAFQHRGAHDTNYSN